jgi:O-antigen ligase
VLCFVLPMRVSYVYILSFILLIILIAEGNLGNKIKTAFQSKLCRAFFAYYCVFIIGMLWTSNAAAGWQMVDRQTPFLLFLLYWSCIEPKFREHYLIAFIAGATLCALLAHYNFLQLNYFPEWPRGIRVLKSAGDTAPFVDRIMYAPILALAIYFSAWYIVTSRNAVFRMVAAVVTGILLSNLLFSGGRAGIVMFAALLISLVFEKVKVRSKAIVICFALCIVAFYSAYKFADHFAERINEGVSDIKNFDENPNTSVGQRLVYWTTSFRLFSNHPLLGVGSGDFQNEYALIKPKRWEATPDSFNPHNQFLMTAATTGLLGLTFLMLIFYYAIKSQADKRTLTLLIGFAVVCLFESYLWRSNTSLTFAVMLAALTTKNSQA